MLPDPDDVLDRDEDNQAISSAGISGDLSVEDEHYYEKCYEQCANTSIQVSGLVVHNQ